MKHQWKGFISGVIVTTLVFGLGIPALAATVRQLNATYSGIKITLDGETITPRDANGTVVEPFAVDGTTYLPLRPLANALGMDVGWDGATQTVILSTGKEPEKDPGAFDAAAVESQLEVKQYGFKSGIWNYAFLEITNNSDFDLDITANANFYDENGQLVGAKTTNEGPVEHGTTAILYFMPDEDYATMKYDLELSEDEYYEGVVSDLSYETTEAENKVILSVTNNGTESAEFVEACMLFYKGDELVDFERNYVTDSDNEIKPGKTLNQEMSCYENFDSYKVFFSGRRTR